MLSIINWNICTHTISVTSIRSKVHRHTHQASSAQRSCWTKTEFRADATGHILDEFYLLEVRESPPLWTPLNDLPGKGQGRAEHGMGAVSDSELLIFGGVVQGGACVAQLFSISFARNPFRWQDLSYIGGAPTARAGHGCVSDMYIHTYTRLCIMYTDTIFEVLLQLMRYMDEHLIYGSLHNCFSTSRAPVSMHKNGVQAQTQWWN
jgi:hypothetical protein